MKTVVQAIASTLQALNNCRKTENTEWINKHEEALKKIAREYLPHGSGFDRGCQITPEISRSGRIVITTSFHHMNENGYYDGWTQHKVIVMPDYGGCKIRITGRDRNSWKEFAYDTFYYCLEVKV